MICPVCKNTQLETRELLENFNAHCCSHCDGHWIRYNDYWNWFTNYIDGSEHTIKDKLDDYLPTLESKQAKLCPDCGRILIKYRIDIRLDFYVDHCGTCNGIWLDKNGWESIRLHDLHNQMHKFFTSPWQKKLHDEAVREQLDKKYITKFGPPDYEKLKKVKVWLDTNVNKSEILAFLMDENPYKL